MIAGSLPLSRSQGTVAHHGWLDEARRTGSPFCAVPGWDHDGVRTGASARPSGATATATSLGAIRESGVADALKHQYNIVIRPYPSGAEMRSGHRKHFISPGRAIKNADWGSVAHTPAMVALVRFTDFSYGTARIPAPGADPVVTDPVFSDVTVYAVVFVHSEMPIVAGPRAGASLDVPSVSFVDARAGEVLEIVSLTLPREHHEVR